jgi:hypothetical protein
MITRRFKFLGLLFLATLVCLTVGFRLFHNRHLEFVSAQADRASSLIETAFREAPPGFESGNVPWYDQKGNTFDDTYFDAWQREITAKPRLRGRHQAAYFYAIDYSQSDRSGQGHHRINVKLVRTPEQLKHEMFAHFGNPLKSIGFVVTTDSPIEQITHGHRSVVTLGHPESHLEVDMRFIFGRDGCTLVKIHLGHE